MIFRQYFSVFTVQVVHFFCSIYYWYYFFYVIVMWMELSFSSHFWICCKNRNVLCILTWYFLFVSLCFRFISCTRPYSQSVEFCFASFFQSRAVFLLISVLRLVTFVDIEGIFSDNNIGMLFLLSSLTFFCTTKFQSIVLSSIVLTFVLLNMLRFLLFESSCLHNIF